MKNDNRNYIIVGTFVIAMVIALIVWVAMLTGGTGPSDDYHVVYGNVMGLKAGTQIQYEGYPVGLIEAIEPYDDDDRRRFRIDVSVQKGWPIPVDSEAKIVVGVFSAPIINIDGGEAEERLPPGSQIQSREATDIFALASEAGDKLDAILEDIAKTAPELLANVETVSVDLRTAMQQINALLDQENVGRVGSILTNVEGATNDLNDLLAGVRETGANLNSLVDNLDALLDEETGDLSQAIDDIRHVVSTLSSDIDSITANLESATRNANEFSKQIRENPGVLLRGRETAE